MCRPRPVLLPQLLHCARGLAAHHFGLLNSGTDPFIHRPSVYPQRAQQTLKIILGITGQEDIPVNPSWRLNERMYGALTGLDKRQTVEKYGEDQVKIWRRSYSTPPPPIDKSSPYWPGNDNKYAHVAEEDIPLSECLKVRVLGRQPALFHCPPLWLELTLPLERMSRQLFPPHASFRSHVSPLHNLRLSSFDAFVSLPLLSGNGLGLRGPVPSVLA